VVPLDISGEARAFRSLRVTSYPKTTSKIRDLEVRGRDPLTEW